LWSGALSGVYIPIWGKFLIAIGLLCLKGLSTLAQGSDPLCYLMEVKKNGDFLFQESGTFVTAASRRSLDEKNNVGLAAAKGALARRFAQDENAHNVRWSAAEIQEPLNCNGFKVISVKVDVRTVKLIKNID
jgi:hypothetical protein